MARTGRPYRASADRTMATPHPRGRADLTATPVTLQGGRCCRLVFRPSVQRPHARARRCNWRHHRSHAENWPRCPLNGQMRTDARSGGHARRYRADSPAVAPGSRWGRGGDGEERSSHRETRIDEGWKRGGRKEGWKRRGRKEGWRERSKNERWKRQGELGCTKVGIEEEYGGYTRRRARHSPQATAVRLSSCSVEPHIRATQACGRSGDITGSRHQGGSGRRLTGELVLVGQLGLPRQLLGRLLLPHQRVVGLHRHRRLFHHLLLYVILQKETQTPS